MQVVVYDANVLYPSTLRDVLIRVGLARLVQPKWTDRILDEMFRNLRSNRPDLDPARLDRTRRLMNNAIRDVTVAGYEHLIDQLALPDADDRHVLAAAVHAEAQVIVTHNLRDFPSDRLTPWGVAARHPDDFLTGLHQDHPDALGRIVAAIAVPFQHKQPSTPGKETTAVGKRSAARRAGRRGFARFNFATSRRRSSSVEATVPFDRQSGGDHGPSHDQGHPS